jgi:putative ABC transport system ATP-binding protein
MGLLKVSGERFAQTIVLITHNPEIAQMADRTVRLEDGQIVARGQ